MRKQERVRFKVKIGLIFFSTVNSWFLNQQPTMLHSVTALSRMLSDTGRIVPSVQTSIMKNPLVAALNDLHNFTAPDSVNVIYFENGFHFESFFFFL
jgi:hypothetical protein